jgi:hypothetical protein
MIPNKMTDHHLGRDRDISEMRSCRVHDKSQVALESLTNDELQEGKKFTSWDTGRVRSPDCLVNYGSAGYGQPLFPRASRSEVVLYDDSKHTFKDV